MSSGKRVPTFVRTPTNSLVHLTAKWVAQSGSLVSSASYMGTRVDYSDIGVYTVALRDTWAGIEAANLTIALTGSKTTGSFTAVLDQTATTVTSTTAPIVKVRTFDSGVPTDLLGCTIYLSLDLRNTNRSV